MDSIQREKGGSISALFCVARSLGYLLFFLDPPEEEFEEDEELFFALLLAAGEEAVFLATGFLAAGALFVFAGALFFTGALLAADFLPALLPVDPLADLLLEPLPAGETLSIISLPTSAAPSTAPLAAPDTTVCTAPLTASTALAKKPFFAGLLRPGVFFAPEVAEVFDLAGVLLAVEAFPALFPVFDLAVDVAIIPPLNVEYFSLEFSN